MINEIEVKTIINKSKLPESDYCINPYIGCLHNCQYCYARFMRRFTGHKEKWGSFVDVKINADTLLEKKLSGKHQIKKVLLGSVCDAYQPIEKKYKITEKCVKILIDHQISFSILTKSSLVHRDLKLFEKAGSLISIGISLSFSDDKFRKIFEPRAASVEERIKIIKTLKEYGISNYLFIGPILPLITDVNNIISEIGSLTDEIWGERLNLKCGNFDDVLYAYKKCHISEDWLNLAQSEEFWNKTNYDMIQMCNQIGVPLKGFYKH